MHLFVSSLFGFCVRLPHQSYKCIIVREPQVGPSPSLSLTLPPSLSLCLGTVEVWCRGGRRCGRGRTNLRGERGCLPNRGRAPQEGRTPLHRAAMEGHAAVAGQLLAAKADVEAQDTVRGQGG